MCKQHVTVVAAGDGAALCTVLHAGTPHIHVRGCEMINERKEGKESCYTQLFSV